MKLSSKMERCGLSPMRKFASYATKAEERGIKIYHLNIGQPDVKTPDVFFKALRDFTEPVLAYAPSVGVPKFLDAVQHYYSRIGVELEHRQPESLLQPDFNTGEQAALMLIWLWRRL